MKRILAFLLILCSLTITAAADIAYEPPVTDFYQKVADKVDRVERYYLANAEAGYVAMLNKPDGNVLSYYKNGEQLFLYGTYFDEGAAWGYIPRDKNGELETPGWIKIEDLSLLYTHLEFRADHAGEQYKTDLSTFEWPAETEYIYLFNYPGCGEPPRKYELGGEDHKKMGSSLSFHWRDGQKRQWAFLGYYMGRQNAFVCLDDPQNPAPFTETTTNKLVGDATLRPAKEPPVVKEAIPKGNLKPLAGGLAAAAVGIAIGLLAAIFHSKKKEERR